MEKRERDLKRLCKRYGVRFERGGKHWRILDQDGNLIQVTSVTGSDHRGMKNLEATLKRITERK